MLARTQDKIVKKKKKKAVPSHMIDALLREYFTSKKMNQVLAEDGLLRNRKLVELVCVGPSTSIEIGKRPRSAFSHRSP